MVKIVKLRKPKTRMERVEWSCLGSIAFVFALFVIAVTVFCLVN